MKIASASALSTGAGEGLSPVVEQAAILVAATSSAPARKAVRRLVDNGRGVPNAAKRDDQSHAVHMD